MKILITGGSGLLGSALTKKLLINNIEVVHLTRSKSSKNDVKNYLWNWEKNEIDENCFIGVTHIVHLAGAGIAEKAWTQKRKELIVKSRVLTTRLMHSKINELNLPISAFIAASAVGIYGAQTSEKVFKEEDEPFEDFLGNCCMQWENSVKKFETMSRVVKLRLGVILDKNHGALPRITNMVKNGIGSPLGNGQQYMPWIHIDDAVSIFFNSIVNEKIFGTFNAVSSDYITNSELTKKIGEVFNKKIWLPNVPSFVLKFLYGEMSDTILKGVKVSNEKLKAIDLKLKYEKIEEALSEIYS
ncbi:MAG: TIGR01777 family oxidoreductase [Flavobacteriales bacterium]|nr:TIGR01777 family oxidoreductase [Flavobacteriales bacterium]